VQLKTRWLLLLAALGLVLVGWWLWAAEHTEPPPLPVLIADLVAVAGLAVGPWLVLIGRQLVRSRDGEPMAGTVFSRVIVVAALIGVGGPLAAVIAATFFSPEQPDLVVVALSVFSIIAATAIALVGGIILPWLFLLTRTLAKERSRRVRAEERAEVAAHLHDSVLQALTLIQKQADDSGAVRRQARSSERELRAWLYGAPPAGEGDFAAAVRAGAEEVEDRFDVSVELVTVGTCTMDERTQAAVGAIREALTNAAKHAQVRRVSVFAEVAGDELFALVRDRGRGFDPAAGAPGDRRGIADSIEARMLRHGGTAAVRSSVGEGTEVELHMRRAAEPVREGDLP
jgi:signal transduction histidine kinase